MGLPTDQIVESYWSSYSSVCLDPQCRSFKCYIQPFPNGLAFHCYSFSRIVNLSRYPYVYVDSWSYLIPIYVMWAVIKACITCINNFATTCVISLSIVIELTSKSIIITINPSVRMYTYFEQMLITIKYFISFKKIITLHTHSFIYCIY